MRKNSPTHSQTTILHMRRTRSDLWFGHDEYWEFAQYESRPAWERGEFTWKSMSTIYTTSINILEHSTPSICQTIQYKTSPAGIITCSLWLSRANNVRESHTYGNITKTSDQGMLNLATPSAACCYIITQMHGQNYQCHVISGNFLFV